MKTKMPTLSEATNLVYKRRYNGEDSATNFLIAMKYNIKAIGNLQVNKITKQHIKKLMDYHRFTRKNSKQVTNTKVGYLKTVLDEMVEDGFIKDVSFPRRLKEKKQKVHYLTQDMERELLSWLNCMQRNREAKDIIECLIDLGCRVNELLNLEKRFVDFDNNQINFNDRKNDNAVAVPMTNRVKSILRRYYREVKDFNKLFSLNYSELNAIWQKARTDLGYADKKFYTLHLCRHTCASRLVQRGCQLLLVKDWLGHEDIKTTMIYAHLAPKALHSIVGVLND
jgi:integrase